MLEKKVERSVQVLEALNGINVMWTDVIIENGQELSRANRACAFSRYQRTEFLAACPDGIIYADLAGLELRPDQPAAD